MKEDKVFEISDSIKKTQEISQNLLKKLLPLIKKQGLTVLLKGDLGSGKTTFTQGLGKFLGIKKINSPTFVILKKYQGACNIKLVHLDCYRLKNFKELQGIGIEKFINKKNILVVVEWPEIILKLKNKIKNKIVLNFSYISKNKRQISIEDIKK
ncbi:MAG: tRNA (adenosine(37)-N6)-threonylcarbamoyltransferase complex ATPase subunit type 1 TsaE [bacterium]|nr:tRNA (adenosine(37)-N6)-threonylcarbamoyltransferase complex ATPase subunit type 1 TsaE [bacterium]